MRNLYFKTFCVLLTLCIFQMQVSCTSYKRISYTELSNLNKSRNYLILETPERKYGVCNFSLKDDTLKGDLINISEPELKSLHVYTPLFFDIDPSNKTVSKLNLHVSNITKIESQKIDAAKNAMLVIGILLTGGILFNEAMKKDFNFNGTLSRWPGW